MVIGLDCVWCYCLEWSDTDIKWKILTGTFDYIISLRMCVCGCVCGCARVCVPRVSLSLPLICTRDSPGR